MAIVIGFSVYELATMAALAITAAYLSTPQGQKATKEVIKNVADQLEKIKQDTASPTQTTDLAPSLPKVKCDPDEGDDKPKRVLLFRGADATNPGAFRVDPDGVSVF